MSALPTTPTIRKTALNAVHRQMGAKMVEFNGWDMPVEYPTSGGIIAEHMAVRTGVGIFDVSHMGDIRLSGPGALAAVQHISMNDAARLAVGQAQYSALLYPQGTFVDDVIVHRLADDEYLLVINAGTREKDFNWVRENTRNFDCRVENLSDVRAEKYPDCKNWLHRRGWIRNLYPCRRGDQRAGLERNSQDWQRLGDSSLRFGRAQYVASRGQASSLRT